MRSVGILGVAVIMLLLLPSQLCAQAGNVKAIVQRESPAIVAVYNLNAKGEVQGTGTGFIIRPDGVMITNFHVIQGARDALIKLKNGEVYDRVWVIDAHPRRDIAVLKIQAIGLPTVTLGDSERSEQGDWCVAIGNPKGLEHTVSDGLISAIRIIEGTKMFQISAPISPGSSGGPLYNSRGEVIGITTAALVGEGVQNLNFAVPLKYALPMLEAQSRLTLAEWAKQWAPEPPGPEPARENQYTDAAGIATVTVAPGWTAGPGEVQGVIMTLTKDVANFQVMFTAGANDVRERFKTGEDALKSTLKKFKPTSDLVAGHHEGRPTMVRFYSGRAHDVEMSAFLGAMITAKGGLLCIGFTREGSEEDMKAMVDMFLSLK